MQKKISTVGLILWLGLGFSALFLLLSSNLFKAISRRTNRNIINDDGLILFELIKEKGFSEEFAKYMTAQAAHETANFSSVLYLKNNSPWGFKYVKNISISEGERNGYAYYKDIAQAVDDYYRLARSWGFWTSVWNLEGFVKLLKEKNFFTDSFDNYYAGVSYFYKLYFE
jgi:hypothetical protein